MPQLNTATAVYLGNLPVSAVYMGGERVWPVRRTGDLLTVRLDRGAGATAHTTVDWGGRAPTHYRYFLSTDGGPWQDKGSSGLTVMMFQSQQGAVVRTKVQSFDDAGLIAEVVSGTVVL